MMKILLIAAALMTTAVAFADMPADSATEDSVAVSEKKIFFEPEFPPEFPGGMDALIDFLCKNLRYPKECAKTKIQGRVVVRFVVRKDGSIDNVEVLRSVHPLLDAEAIRVVKSFPKWIPGRRLNEPVDVRFNLPVTFKL